MSGDPAAVVEHEPDYRFSLANERTLLAWFRTALALLASSIGVAQLVPAFTVPGAREAVSAVLGVLSVCASAGGVRHWQRVQTAMRRGEPLPPSGLAKAQAVGLVLVAVSVVLLALA
jgi:putative membrane protein